VVQIAEGGVFHGTVSVDRAEIRGRFEGDMTVRERLTVHSTGRVAGKVRFGRLAVEDGGEIVGEIEALPRHDSQDAAKALSGADPAGRPRREPFVHPSPAAAARNGERAQAGQP
jgi:cytoskeletal protein CcmA (bactofilin family)